MLNCEANFKNNKSPGDMHTHKQISKHGQVKSINVQCSQKEPDDFDEICQDRL